MAVKPESQFISGVHKYLASARVLHREKMNNPYRSGTADVWYSAKKNDLWIEYKFLPRVPQRGVVTPALSEIQKLWLAGRYEEGRNVGVIVGCPAGGVILRDLEWENPILPSVFNQMIRTREELAAWITQQVLST